MKRFRYYLLLLMGLVIAPAALAQADCPAIIETVMANLEQVCADAGRNEACYGSLAMDVLPQPDVTDFRFEQVGDIEDVSDFQSLRLSPLDTEAEAWGVALMRLQANLPDVLPGQNVTFLLFGDVEIVNAVAPNNAGMKPFQAFYLRTGIGDAACQEAPQNGMMIQTAKGLGEVTFNVNGVEMAVGSTVYLQAQPSGEMRVRTLQGSAAIRTVDNLVTPIIAGTETRIPLDKNLLPDGLPIPPIAYEIDDLLSVPFNLFDEDFEFVDPLSDEEIAELLDLIENDFALCHEGSEGESFLPDCEDVIYSLGGDLCALDENGEELCKFFDEDGEFFWQDAFDEDGDIDEFLVYDDFDELWSDTWDDDFWEDWEGASDFNDDGFGLDSLEDFEFDRSEFEDFGDFELDLGLDDDDDFDAEFDEEDDDDFSEEPSSAADDEDLPPGCYDGVCLEAPETACQCALCGVECPAGDGDFDNDGSFDDDGDFGDEDFDDADFPEDDFGDEEEFSDEGGDDDP